MRNIYLIFVLFILSCKMHTYTFTPKADNSSYPANVPCMVRFMVTVNSQELQNYKYIGTCFSKATTSFNGSNARKNEAMEQIRKCACENGGDLISIIETGEATTINGGLVDQLNPNAERIPYADMAKGELFRKIN